VKDATFRFVDQVTRERLSAPYNAPSDTQLKIESRYNDWRYWNGVINIAMNQVGEALHDTTFADYSERNIAFCLDNGRYFENSHKSEDKWSYPFGQMFTMNELDDCGAMGASVIEVYLKDRERRYKDYIDRAANHIENVQARLSDGTLVRSFPRKWTLWADDLYMSVSFLSRMGELTGNERYFDDASRQVINFHRYLFDQSAGLMRHCWFSDSGRPGVAFWGRANGWTLVAQVDLLDRLPLNFGQRDTLLSLLRRDIAGIVRYEGSDGMWHQLLDKTDSYEETSCTAMFTYTIARGVIKGYISSEYEAAARRAWKGVVKKIRPDGQIEGVCTGTGVGDDLAFYYKRPAPLNDVHGVGAVLLAGSEMMQLQK